MGEKAPDRNTVASLESVCAFVLLQWKCIFSETSTVVGSLKGKGKFWFFFLEEGLSGRAGCRNPSCHDLHYSHSVGRTDEFSMHIILVLGSRSPSSPLPSCLAVLLSAVECLLACILETIADCWDLKAFICCLAMPQPVKIYSDNSKDCHRVCDMTT